MPSDVEMSDCDASPFDGHIDLDPAIASSVTAGPERVTHNCKDYVRRPTIHAAEAPSVIWRLGEEYERRRKRFWRCGICKKNKLLAIQRGTSSALRHLKRDHNIDKGKRIRTNQKPLLGAAKPVAQVITRFNATTFRYLLIRWIVTTHIALTCVESDTFRECDGLTPAGYA
jgi:hypothetical protein